MRAAGDALAFFREIEAAPYRFDFYQALRRTECLHPHMPRIGKALKPADEPLRLGQEPALSFAPASLSALKFPAGAKAPRLEQRFFGLTGPNGPLPLHLTEHARDRLLHAGDPTFARFLDLLNHRFTALLYRAWAQAQPTVSLDRPREDRFAVYVGALIGLAGAKARARDALPDRAKLHGAAWLGRQVRNPDGLAALLDGFFRVPVRVEEFVGHWMKLPAGERTRLGAGNDSARLGGGATLGGRVWDRQHKFRLQFGPLTLAQYEGFLPGSQPLSRLVAWVRHYVGFEFAWDLRLVLKHDEVPPLRLGGRCRLGWTTWLGQRRTARDAGDLVLDAEGLMAI